MLLLAGLLGMLAVGSIVFMEPGAEDDLDTGEGAEEMGLSDQDQQLTLPVGDDTDPQETDNPPQMSNDIAPDMAADTGSVADDVDGNETKTSEPSTAPAPPAILVHTDESGATIVAPNEPTDQHNLLAGTAANESIDALAGDDQILGAGGNDTLIGNAGDDSLLGEEGADLLIGGAGADHLSGGMGDDVLQGGAGSDILYGSSGADLLEGGDGADDLWGGSENDSLDGGAGNDVLRGHDGDDLLSGGRGSDTIQAGSGNDWIDGRQGEAASGDADFLNGGDGNDTLLAGAGDHVSGGAGADEMHVHSTTEGNGPHFWDFASGEDSIVILYEAGHDAPEIAINTDESTPGQWVVQADGETVATVHGTQPALSDVSALPALSGG